MSRYITQFKCARCVRERQHEWLFIANKKNRWYHIDYCSKGMINKNRRFRKYLGVAKPLSSDDKISSMEKGAGFWPLAGCSASQPLPKMWEARKLLPNQWCVVSSVVSGNHLQDSTLPPPHQDVGCVNTVMSNWKKTASSAYAKVQTWWVWKRTPPPKKKKKTPFDTRPMLRCYCRTGCIHLWVDHQVMLFPTASDCGITASPELLRSCWSVFCDFDRL